jgi:hypothetical protein
MRSAGLCTRPADSPRREIETDQVVEGAARLLGVHQIEGEFARVLHRLLDGALGDLVEHDAADLLAVEQLLSLEDLVQVPGNGLAFAIRVSRQEQAIRLLERLGDGVNVLFVLLDQLVLHGEVVIGIDRALFRQQVAHVTVGGEDLEVLAQIFLDRLRLGRRFHNDEVLAHFPHPKKAMPAVRGHWIGLADGSISGAWSPCRPAPDLPSRRRPPPAQAD